MVTDLRTEVEAVDARRQTGCRVQYARAVRAADEMHFGVRGDERTADLEGGIECRPQFPRRVHGTSAQMKIIRDKRVDIDVNCAKLAE